MLLEVNVQSIDHSDIQDSFHVDDTTPVYGPISFLDNANISIRLNGIMVGRLDYVIDRTNSQLKGRNFNRMTLNRFEKIVMRRYGLDRFWLGTLGDF